MKRRRLELPGDDVHLRFQVVDEADAVQGRKEAGDLDIVLFDHEGRHGVSIDLREQQALLKFLSGLPALKKKEPRR